LKRGQSAAIASIGSLGSINLTYPTSQLGHGTKSLLEIACGKSPDLVKSSSSGFLQGAHKAVLVLGAATLERADANSLIGVTRHILQLAARISPMQQLLERKSFSVLGPCDSPLPAHLGNHGVNVLHTSASMPGALDLGFSAGKNLFFRKLLGPASNRCIFLLGADPLHFPPSIGPETSIIYQGHHGS
jgi:hypothetical protein